MATKKTQPRRAPQGAAAPTTKPADAQGLILRVIAKRDGFRRAGRTFGSEPVDIALSELSDKDYAALTTEPMLVAYLGDPDQAEAEDPAASTTEG